MEQAREEFLTYTKTYLNLGLGKAIKLKIDHTLRVMNLCEEIARRKKLSSEEIELAKLSGLLHDIARFEQYKRYQTFVDSKSIDHGDLGVKILKDHDFIRKFSKEKKFDSVILKVVKYHNKYLLPKDLTTKERLFCNLVKDADKIDILYLYAIEEVSLPMDQESFSEEVFNQLKKEQLVDRSILKTKVDRLAISLGFVFDIAFWESMDILREKDYINQEIEVYEQKGISKKLREQLEEMRIIIQNYMKRRAEDVR